MLNDEGNKAFSGLSRRDASNLVVSVQPPDAFFYHASMDGPCQVSSHPGRGFRLRKEAGRSLSWRYGCAPDPDDCCLSEGNGDYVFNIN